MEAPEKIYVQLPSNKWIGRTWDEAPIKEGDNPNWKNATNIEYTRTDAFIEKAVRWLNEHMIDYMEFNGYGGCLDAFNDAKMVEDFKNYMKGE